MASSTKNLIICDIDGTLADVGHRLHFVTKKPKNWKGFFEAMIKDSLNVWCAVLLQAMARQGYKIFLVSGRPEDYRSHTEEWLKKHKVTYDKLLMRKAGDFRKDDIVKRELLYKIGKEKILFVVDDRQSVVDMWRKEGLLCLQCNPEPSVDLGKDYV